MANMFTGDNDHGDAVPPTDVLLQRIKLLREDVVHFANELNEVTHQRDEARREICERVSTTRWQPQFPLMTKRQYAEERGWNCFKENTNV